MLVQETIVQTSRQTGTDSPAPTALRRGDEGRAKVREEVEEIDGQVLPAQRAEPDDQVSSEKASRARLSLDPELHRVFVEIVDPKTGDVITRFPPEQIADHIDSVLERTGQETNLEDSGLIVDESV